jgi:hypothetical protein
VRSLPPASPLNCQQQDDGKGEKFRARKAREAAAKAAAVATDNTPKQN